MNGGKRLVANTHSRTLQHGFDQRDNLLHVGGHVAADPVRVVVEEIKPRHDSVLGMEAFNHLMRHFLHVSDQCVVGCTVDFVGIDGAFERAPIRPKGLLGFRLCGFWIVPRA